MYNVDSRTTRKKQKKKKKKKKKKDSLNFKREEKRNEAWGAAAHGVMESWT